MAGGLGFEPRLTESESAVLPLDDPPSEQGIGKGEISAEPTQAIGTGPAN